MKILLLGDIVGNAPGAFFLHPGGSVAGTSRFLGIFDSGGNEMSLVGGCHGLAPLISGFHCF